MPDPLPDVLPMRPHLRETVWGGRRLAELYGRALPEGKPIGESLEISAYPERESCVATGPLAGRDLRTLAEEYGEDLLGRQAWRESEGRFPLLIKLLDAQEDLSVQVHPDDVYVRSRGLSGRGKTEAWYVLHSQGGRVAHGLRPGVGRKELGAALRHGRVEEVIQFFPVQAGDVIYSPPGTVHALGGGVVVYEVQQSSDITFRMHDYGRLGLDGKARALHLEQAVEVVDFSHMSSGPVSWRQLPGDAGGSVRLVACEHFRVDLHHQAPESRSRHRAGESFAGLTLIAGQAVIGGSGQSHVLKAGETALIPANRGFELEAGADGACAYLVARTAAGHASVRTAQPAEGGDR